VLAGDIFYPAIVGDVGPRTKIGEASLRLCREINPRANGDVRAVNDLKVTYIVFPNSAEKETGPPDLLLWQTRCDTLLKELGDYRGKFFHWEEPPPPPPVAPETAPAPAGAPDAQPVTPATTPPAAAVETVPAIGHSPTPEGAPSAVPAVKRLKAKAKKQ